jgi:hypothetical protein
MCRTVPTVSFWGGKVVICPLFIRRRDVDFAPQLTSLSVVGPDLESYRFLLPQVGQPD